LRSTIGEVAVSEAVAEARCGVVGWTPSRRKFPSGMPWNSKRPTLPASLLVVARAETLPPAVSPSSRMMPPPTGIVFAASFQSVPRTSPRWSR
jgi:hypothetical protein